ncbi:hypothetical protein Leryth_021706 [Lithospermum erythrorhizon]|nr:hypothetical protein Leryth_021706 [Lithospermum erythrorhizon]
MSLKGKVLKQIEIKSDCDMFHDLMCHKPHEISNICPGTVQGVELHEGQWGTAGSVICWNYVHDGVQSIGKEIVEPDMANKKIKFTMIEGDLLKLYKSFVITFHVDKFDEYHLVSWTFEYEKMNEDIPAPDSLMDLFTKITRDIESHHLA